MWAGSQSISITAICGPVPKTVLVLSQYLWSLNEQMPDHKELWTRDAMRSHEGQEPETRTRTDACWLTLFPLCPSPRLQSQLLPPLAAASVFAFSTPVSELKTLLVSYSLRIMPKIFPITFKPFMTCPHQPHLTLFHSTLWGFSLFLQRAFRELTSGS